jgi:hypothetical protein
MLRAEMLLHVGLNEIDIPIIVPCDLLSSDIYDYSAKSDNLIIKQILPSHYQAYVIIREEPSGS